MPYFIKGLGHIQKTPRDSRVGYASKAEYILWTMDNGWFTQESLARKPDWSPESNLHSSRYSKAELKISLSNTFPQIDSSETSL